MFRHFDKSASVSRQGYTESGWYKQSGFVATGKSFMWHLKAQSLQALVDVNAFGREYTFTTDATADIQESDKLTIDGVTYDVKGVAKFHGITFNTLQCLLSISENE